LYSWIQKYAVAKAKVFPHLEAWVQRTKKLLRLVMCGLVLPRKKHCEQQQTLNQGILRAHAIDLSNIRHLTHLATPEALCLGFSRVLSFSSETVL
jgi:hypothetical protein